MPVFVLKCPECGERVERLMSFDELTEGLDKESLLCYADGTPLRRDFQSEKAAPLYHPSHSLRVKQKELSDRWGAAVAEGVAAGYSDD